jgi:hypothetical protein
MKRDRFARIQIRVGILLVAGIGVALLTAIPAVAQTGVIAFRDDCNGLLYAMRSNGTERVVLPFPPLPLPTDRYVSPFVLDVTTSGPLTVVYRVGIGRIVIIEGKPTLELIDKGVFAVQVNDVGGVLMLDPLIRLSLPEIAGVDPNQAWHGSFSPIGSGDRLALVANSEAASVLMTARVERDITMRIIALSDLIVVGDLLSIGLPDPKFPTAPGFTGDIDYSPDGNSIAASIYLDLWRIHLAADNTYLSAERLTENTDGFAEWKPSFSPDGSHVAYTGGLFRGSGVRETHIYSLDLSSGTASPVTTNKNTDGAASDRNNPMWSPDGGSIGFTAFTSRTPRNSPCSGLVNSEIFLIQADGSATATPLTNTNGTSVEAWPRWGW